MLVPFYLLKLVFGGGDFNFMFSWCSFQLL